MPKQIVVEGKQEVINALNDVKEFDKDAAANNAAFALLPSVKANTRVRTGLLSASWEVEEGAFVNDVPYVVPQEFGSRYIEGSFATVRAFAEHEDEVVKAYEKEIEDAARQAGFNPK